MGTQNNNLELTDRLELIESMIAEGRRQGESWGWTFVLWGVAYYTAFFWETWGRFHYAWPIVMIAAAILTVAGFTRKKRMGPRTTLGRAIGSIWMATGASMFILFDALGFSGHMTDPRVFFAGASAILGLANAACGLTLKWKEELACALVWWATAVVASVASVHAAADAFLAAIFLCQILFGLYVMILESRRRRKSRAAQA